jgi:hypothetical protein
VEKRRRALVIPKLLKEAERVSKTSKSLRGTIEIVEADGLCLKAGTRNHDLKLLRPARVSTATKGECICVGNPPALFTNTHPAHSEEQAPFHLYKPTTKEYSAEMLYLENGDITTL